MGNAKEVDSVVELRSGMQKALGWIPSTEKKRKHSGSRSKWKSSFFSSSLCSINEMFLRKNWSTLLWPL